MRNPREEKDRLDCDRDIVQRKDQVMSDGFTGGDKDESHVTATFIRASGTAYSCITCLCLDPAAGKRAQKRGTAPNGS